MKDRPPDNQQDITLTHVNNPTDGNQKIQTKIDSILDPKITDTVHTFLSTSPPPAMTISDQNQPKLIRAIDPLSQQTPTCAISDQIADPSLTSIRLDNSGEAAAGKNGESVVEIPTNHPQTTDNNQNGQFPKLTSNFDRSRISHRSTFPTATKQHPQPVRQIVQKSSELPSSTQANQSVIPSIHQLKTKFNDHSNTNPHTNYKPNVFSEPSPPTVIPTFASKLRAVQPLLPTIELAPTRKTTKQGYPAVIFKREDFMVKLAARCKYTVIGKFSSTMPKMELIRSSLTAQLQLKGSLKVTHFNSRHIYIDLDNEHDHATVWHREKIYVEGRPVRLFVWTPTFKPEQETPIAPVWVVLPQLPWHCYCMEMVSELLEPVGRSLFLDAATFQKTRGSVAKVKIELDLSKPRPKFVWLGYDDDEFGEGQWQEIQYENVPDYCMYCKHKGHSEHSCTIKGRDDEVQKRKVQQEEEVPTSSRIMQNDQIPPNTQRRNELPTHPNKDTTVRKAVKQVYVPRNSVVSTVNTKDTRLSVLSSLVPAPLIRNNAVSKATNATKEPVKHGLKDLHCQNPFDVLAEDSVLEGHIDPVNNGGSSTALTDCGVPEKQAYMHVSGKTEHFSAATGTKQQPGTVGESPHFFFGTKDSNIRMNASATTPPSDAVAAESSKNFGKVAGLTDAVNNLHSNTVRLSTAVAVTNNPHDNTVCDGKYAHNDNIIKAPIGCSSVCHDTHGFALQSATDTPAVNALGENKAASASVNATSNADEEIEEAGASAVPGTDQPPCDSVAGLSVNTGTSDTLHVPEVVPVAAVTPATVESTKAWVERSFVKFVIPDSVPVVVGEHAFHQQTCNEDEGNTVEIANDTAAATAAAIDQVPVSQHTCATAGTTAHNSKEKPGKTKKKQRKDSVQAKLKACHDARLAKLNEENPRIYSVQNREPLSIHSQLKQYAGYEHDPDVIFLGDMFNDCMDGNALTPTPQLEIMCNEASKVMKIAGQSNWNLNAQPFTPKSIPTQGILVATESIDFKKSEPNDVATETDFKKSDTALVQPQRVQPSRSSRSKSYRGKG